MFPAVLSALLVFFGLRILVSCLLPKRGWQSELGPPHIEFISPFFSFNVAIHLCRVKCQCCIILIFTYHLYFAGVSEYISLSILLFLFFFFLIKIIDRSCLGLFEYIFSVGPEGDREGFS
jgi:hypothetical protein